MGDVIQPSGDGTVVSAPIYASLMALAGELVPSTQDVVRVDGYAAGGDGGDGLARRYASNPTQVAAQAKVQSQDGAWWVPMPLLGELAIERVGGKGDATISGTYTATAGTNNNLAHQAAESVLGYTVVSPNYIYGATIVYGYGDYWFPDGAVNLKKGCKVKGRLNGIQSINYPTKLFFPNGSHGIITHQFNTLGSGSDTGPAPLQGSDNMEIEGICVVSADAGTVAGSIGFWQRKSTSWRKCVSIGFGDGFACWAASSGGTAPLGNCNGFYLEKCLARNTFRHGLYCQGIDANAGTTVGFQAFSSIGGCGIMDGASGLGNCHIGSQIDSFNNNNKGRVKRTVTASTYTATISGTTMAVTASASGGIVVGQMLAESPSVTIASIVTGQGGVGTYTLSADPGVTSSTNTTHTVTFMFIGTFLTQATTITPGSNPQIWYPLGLTAALSGNPPEWANSGDYEWSMPICIVGPSNRGGVILPYTEGGVSHCSSLAYAIPGQAGFTNLTRKPPSATGQSILSPGNALGSTFTVRFGDDPDNGFIWGASNQADGNFLWQCRALSRDIVEQLQGVTTLRRTGQRTERKMGRPNPQTGKIVLTGGLALGDPTDPAVERLLYSRAGTPTAGTFASGEYAFRRTPVAGGPAIDAVTTGGSIQNTSWSPSTAVAIDTVRTNDGGKYYIVTKAGTTAASGGPSGTGANIVDGTAEWAYQNPFVFSPIYSENRVSITYDPPSIAAGGTATTAIPLASSVLGDMAGASFSIALSGLLLFVEAQAGQVQVTFFNPTAAAIDRPSGTLRVWHKKQ